ncbi:MAG: YceD family protein [Sphingobacteriaceae bacterium]
MKSLQEYKIPFTGLKIGKHQFDFDIDERFFNEFEYSLVKNGKLKVGMELDKQETMLILSFEINGEIFSTCDFCLSDFPTNVSVSERQIVKFSEDENLEDDTDEIIVLGRNEHEINVSQLIYEYINLAVPLFNRCEDVGNTQYCDKEVIEKLKTLSPNNEEQENNDADPRWEALKNIKNDN